MKFRLTLPRNWKSYAGGLLIVAAALAQYKHLIDPGTAAMATHVGEGLLGIGLAHKLERAIGALVEKS